MQNVTALVRRASTLRSPAQRLHSSAAACRTRAACVHRPSLRSPPRLAPPHQRCAQRRERRRPAYRHLSCVPPNRASLAFRSAKCADSTFPQLESWHPNSPDRAQDSALQLKQPAQRLRYVVEATVAPRLSERPSSILPQLQNVVRLTAP